MIQPGKWAMGLLPLAGLCVVAGLWRQSSVEQELGSRSAAALAASGADWVKIALSGRDAVITGEAPSPEARAAALSSVGNEFGVRLVEDAMTLLAEARPFTFLAQREGAKLTLSGAVPPGAARAALIAAAKTAMPEAAIADGLKPARGAPPEFAALTAYGLGELGKLDPGTLALTDKAMAISGRAIDLAKFTEIRARLAAPPAGTQLTKGLGAGDILPPIARPFTFLAERSGPTVRLSGFVPSDEIRARIAGAAGGAVSDQLQIADGAPAGDWAGAAALLARSVAALDSGRASLSDNQATLTGTARDVPGEEAVIAGLGALPSGFVLASPTIDSPEIKPFVFTATRAGTRLTLAGLAPPGPGRAGVLEAARRAVPDATIDDGLKPARGAAPAFAAISAYGLAELGKLDPGTLTLTDGAIAISGRAIDLARFTDIRSKLASLPAGARLVQGLGVGDILPPIAKPFSFAAERAAGSLRLTGYVPSDEIRARLIGAASLPGVAVSDQLQLADGAPGGDWPGAAAVLVRAAAALESGRASLSDDKGTIAGTARDLGAEESIRGSLGGLPAGFALTSATITSPDVKPFTFSAAREGAQVTLSGYIPPGPARAALLDAAKKAVPDAAIVDNLKPARGAPAEFAALAAFGLAELGKLNPGTLSLADSAIGLAGRAADPAKYAELRSRLAALPAGARLAKGLGAGDILPPIVKPFAMAAELAGGTVRLSGVVPSEDSRARIVAAAAALRQPVSDQLQIADGAPPGDWTGAAAALLRSLGRLETGRVALVDDKASVTGKARGTNTEDDVRGDLGSLPAGFALASSAIESRIVRPYLFTAERSAGLVALSGNVPDAKVKAEVLDLARRYFEGERIEDTLSEGLGAPKDFTLAIRSGFQHLARLADGARFAISDATAGLSGSALYEAARDQVASDFRRDLPGSFKASAELATAPLPAPISDGAECQILYKDALARGSIRFRSGSADLSDESRGLVDRLVVVTLRCAEAKIEIGGHTDSDGSPQANADLSRRRAETIAAYFVRAGVPTDRIEAVGYGETVPIAPNDSPENKAKNRRIEFVVQ